MILFGGRLSPFVRRVAVSLTLQGRPFERQIVNVLQSDFGGITEANPLGRVPVLRLDDGMDLIETSAIIDYLDQTAAEGKRLFPADGLSRIAHLQIAGYANGVAEKGVALVYEAIRRPAGAADHCRTQSSGNAGRQCRVAGERLSQRGDHRHGLRPRLHRHGAPSAGEAAAASSGCSFGQSKRASRVRLKLPGHDLIRSIPASPDPLPMPALRHFHWRPGRAGRPRGGGSASPGRGVWDRARCAPCRGS
jgi:glutathione S-transferase